MAGEGFNISLSPNGLSSRLLILPVESQFMLTNSGQLSVNSAKAALLKAYRPIANPEELMQTINKSQYSVAGIYYALLESTVPTMALLLTVIQQVLSQYFTHTL